MKSARSVKENTTDIKEKIIVALDVSTADEARELIAELGAEVGAFKIGLQLFTAAGADFVRETVGAGIKLFLDLKFHDIPNTVAAAAVEAVRLGVWMFNVHTLGGAEMMQKTVERVSEACARDKLPKPLIIGVTVLTSSDRETMRRIGIEKEVGEQVLSLAHLASECKLDGVVASPLEVAAIRRSVGEKFAIVTPGIRLPENETADDQKRVMSPAEAVRAGSDFLVIGRPILQAADRIGAVRRIIKEIA